MSDSKVFMFPDTNSSQLDPNLMMALNNNGGFGNNGNWMWIIFLFFLYPLMRNGGMFGNGNISALETGYLSNLIANGTGRDLLMQAINGNAQSLQTLSSTLNCDVNSIKSAMNSLQSAICQVGNQVGMSGTQVVNAVQSGNAALGQQIAQCCCDNKLLVTNQGYENQLATLNQTNTLQQSINANTVHQDEGFNTLTYQNQVLTTNLQGTINNGVLTIKDSTVAQTNAIMAKLDAIEDSRKDREINTLTAQLAAVNAKAEREAELAPITKALSEIQCKQPNTVTLPYSCATAVPTGLVYQGLNTTGSIWS